MLRIGLTGGIAAGKSVASSRLAALGAVLLDYDVLAREAVHPGSVGLDAVVDAFGPDVLLADGSLDRPRLGSIVFGDEAARARLDAIVHPEVRRLAAEQEAAAAAAATDDRAIVVHDVPLLVESEREDEFHLVVVVVAPVEQRVARMIATRGLDEAAARARIAAQADDAARVAVADVVLDGSGSEAALVEQVDALWERLRAEVAAEDDAGTR